MEITIENWKDAERDLKEAGVEDAVYDENGFVQTIISKSGMRYELSAAIVRQLLESGLVEIKPGLRVKH